MPIDNSSIALGADSEKSHQITIGAIAKNEQRYILEWIAYHFAIGVSRIIVYSNDTEDSQCEILDRLASNDQRLTWINWPSSSCALPQIGAYNNALKLVSTHWIGFLDIDEFIVPLDHDDIRGWLASIPQEISTVHINWRGFGSGGDVSSDYDLVSRRFMYASEATWSNNYHFKSIGRTKKLSEANIHNLVSFRGRRTLSDFTDFETINEGLSDRVVHHKIQINHYQCKTYGEFKLRMERGNAYFPLGHPDRARDGSIARFEQLDCNEYYDASIRRFDERVDTELARLKSYL